MRERLAMGIRRMYKASGGATFNKKCSECKYLTGSRLAICTYNGIEYVNGNSVACGFFKDRPARKSRRIALGDEPELQQMSLFELL